jgi:hypothetical protein
MKPFLFGHIAPSLKSLLMPMDVATEVVAFTGKRGSGKTHGAKVLVEGLRAANQQVVVGDPQNVWWGLRASKSGKSAGLDMVIFGGDHADQPLLEATGRMVADFVVDTGSSIVLSMRHLSKAAMRRFMADFAERLMERKAEAQHQTPLMLVLDEADILLPQRVMPDSTRCFSILDDVVRRGRSSGMGVTMITQRPAILNKDVLSMAEILVAMQTTGPLDRAAVLDWVKAHADADEAKEFLQTLPKLKRGEGWIWSPVFLNVLERVQIIDTTTYDSSYTPKVGERRVAVTLKPVDMKRLTAELQAVAKELEENKPGALKAKIKALEAQVAAKQAPEGASKEELKAEYLRGKKDGAVAQRAEIRKLLTTPETGLIVLGTIVSAMDQMEGEAPKLTPRTAFAKGGGMDAIDRLEKATAGFTPRKQVSVPTTPVRFDDSIKLGKPHRKALMVLAQYGHRSKEYVAAHAGYSVNAGHFSNCLGDLRKAGWIENVGGGLLDITAEGREKLGSVPPLPTGEALWQQWMGKVGKCHRQVLQVLKDGGNAALERFDLASSAGYSVNAGHFSNCLGDLRGLNLITSGNPVSLTAEFWEAINS